ncbi:MAG: AI-2E family transporter [Crocinitomicaceae bacterium]
MVNQRRFQTILIIALIGLAIYFGSIIVMPIIFSAFLAMFCYPLVERMEDIGIPSWLSITFTVLGVSLLLLIIIILFSVEGVQIAKELPNANMDSKIKEAFDNPVQVMEDNTKGDTSLYLDEVRKLFGTLQEKFVALIPKILVRLKNVFVFLATCPIYVFFMLLSREQIKKSYFSFFNGKNKIIAKRALVQVQRVLSEYLKGMGIVIVVVTTLTSLGLYLLGIEHALFFGLLAGFLTIIPYLGVVISAILPTALALVTKDSLWYPLGVVGIFGLVQFLEGNIITPKIMSSQVGLNPLAVIVALILFGAIGGLLGVMITVPTLAVLKTVSYYVPGWKPLTNFLQV